MLLLLRLAAVILVLTSFGASTAAWAEESTPGAARADGQSPGQEESVDVDADPTLPVGQQPLAIEGDQPTWRLTTTPAAYTELSGFSVGESILPGDPLQLKLFGTATSVTVEVFRIGDYAGAGGLLVASVAGLPLAVQPDCTLVDRTYDCSGWGVSHVFDTSGWEPGLYLTKLTDDLGRQRYVATILRSPSHAGKVVIMSATATHAAYNSVGEYSLYRGPGGDGATRAHTVSLNRPDRDQGASKIYAYEVGLIQYLESLDVPLSYTTNAELDGGADRYAGARALVTLGHDEYWSVAMRDAAQTLRDRGTNLVMLGANTMFWRIRWNADHTRVTSYKDADLDPVKSIETTARFRDAPFPNPEASLLGSQYDCDGANPQTDLVVVDPGFWAFRGTGVSAGDRIAKLVGHEVDKAGPDSPTLVHIAAHSTFRCTNRDGYSDITYYVAPSQAGVLNLGTMGFAYALTPGTNYPAPSVAFAKQVIANVIEEAAAGPMGRRVTAPGNYESVYGQRPPAEVDPYVTEGEHVVNGRRWRTKCEPYSQTSRCRTEIFATQVTLVGGRFTPRNDWYFNNLTYLPQMTRSQWVGNPLGANGSWTATDGRAWRTECDTAVTGRNGCRSYVRSRVIEAVPRTGGYTYKVVSREVFNNLVRFK